MERTDFEQWKAKEVARLLALVETERRYYQEMVASLPVALVVLSADRSIVSANRAFRQTFGVRIEDLRHKTIEQILPSEELVEKIREAHLSRTSQPPFFLEIGGRQLRFAIVPIRNWDDESEVETLLMVEDARALTAEQPAAMPTVAPVIETAPAALAIADVPAIVWQADPQTLRFRSVSGAAEQLLGFPPEHWTRTEQFFRDRIHPEDRAATMAFYEAMLQRKPAKESDRDASAEFRAVTDAGGTVWVRETIRVPQPGDADPVIRGVMTDISRRKQLEQQLLTAERSDALHGLAGRLAHDLNNPLMIISGYGEELLQSLPPENPMRGDIQQILGASERISGVTGQLLGFTRKLAAEPQPVNVAALLGGMEERIVAAAGATVTVEFTYGDGPVWTMADPEQLEEVILAVTSEAREGARERSRVTIGCGTETIAERLAESTLKPGTYTRIAIHDNGEGVDGGRRAAIFESVLDGKEPEAGGAALARAYSLVREWGGDIAFSSEPFRGSTFLIYLPYFQPEPAGVEPEKAAPPEIAAPVEIAAPAAAVSLGTILLVEDEAGIRALVRKILRREGYEVLEAGSGEEALNVAASYQAKIDLLLTDVVLPGMGGRQLAESMREWKPSMKVLYVSGYSDDEAVRAGAFPPGSKFLQKPFTLSALVGAVREAMAGEP